MEKANVTTQDNIIDIDFGAIKKSRFRLNGDNSKIFELNVSDMNIVQRLNESYPKLNKLQEKVQKLQLKENTSADATEEEDVKAVAEMGEKLKELDDEMKSIIDYIFDSNVSEVCAGSGSMYDPIDGMFRYEHIIDKLTSLYTDNLNSEFKKMKTRINKYAKK